MKEIPLPFFCYGGSELVYSTIGHLRLLSAILLYSVQVPPAAFRRQSDDVGMPFTLPLKVVVNRRSTPKAHC